MLIAFLNIPFSIPAQSLTYNSGFELRNTQPFCRGVNLQDVMSDAAGNTYATGSFDLNADADPGAAAVRLQSIAGNDLFFTKYNSTGVLQFALQIGGAANLLSSRITMATNGQIILCGKFEQSITLNTTSGSTQSLTNTGGADIFIASYTPQGQLLQALQIGGTGTLDLLDITTASNGDVVMVGSLSGEADVDPGAGVVALTSAGSTDGFVLKLNNAFAYLLAFKVGGANGDTGDAIAVDDSGNLYFAGTFRGTVDFDAGPGVTNLIASGSNSDVFFAKYSSTGTLLFAKKVGGSLNDFARNIAVDATGNILLCGDFFGTANFDPNGTFNLTSAGASDGFFARYSNTGTLVFANKLGGTSTDGCTALSISGSSLWLAGRYSASTDFDPGAASATLTSAGGTDGWIGKYNLSTGVYEQAWSFGNKLNDWVSCLFVGSNGALYIGGNFEDTVDFDPGSGVAQRISTIGYSNGVVMQFNSAGTHAWNSTIGGFSPLHSEFSTAMAVAPNGNIIVTGDQQGPVDFDPGPGSQIITGLSTYRPFVATYTPAGVLQQVFSLMPTAFTQSKAVAVDAASNIITAGEFTSTLDTDPGPGTNLLVANGTSTGDIYLAKYNSSGTLLWSFAIGGAGFERPSALGTDAQMNVYLLAHFAGTIDVDPSPAVVNLVSSGSTDLCLIKYNAAGQLVYAIKMGGTLEEISYCMAVTPAGEVVIGGTFRGSVDFDPGPNVFSIASNGATDVCIARYNAQGEFMFAKTVGGINTDIIRDIQFDNEGNLIAIGTYTSTTDFDPGSGSFLITTAGLGDIFVLKLTGTGDFIWAKRMGGPGTDFGKQISIASDNSIITSGRFVQTANFDSTGTNTLLTSKGFDDWYVCALSASGQFQYVQQMGSTNGEDLTTMKIGTANRLHLLGYTLGTEFDMDGSSSQTAFLHAINGEDIVVGNYTLTLATGTVTYSWTGAISTDWHNAANWSSNVVPTSTSVVTIPAGRPRYPVVNTTTTVKSITCATGASVQVAAGVVLNILK